MEVYAPARDLNLCEWQVDAGGHAAGGAVAILATVEGLERRGFVVLSLLCAAGLKAVRAYSGWTS